MYVTHRIPSVLESQKSSKRARSRGGVAPSCQPKNASSAWTLKLGYCSFGGGASPMMSASDFEKLFVSAITRHLRSAASDGGERECFAEAQRGERATSNAPDRLDDTLIELAALSHHAPEQLTFPFSHRRLRWRKPGGREGDGLTSRPSMCSVSGRFGHAAGTSLSITAPLRAMRRSSTNLVRAACST